MGHGKNIALGVGGWVAILLILMGMMSAWVASALRAPPLAYAFEESTDAFGTIGKPQRGETCLVCNEPVGVDDRVYIVNGQRVPTHVVGCDAELKRAPERYLARLKPRGAFLGAEPGPRATLSPSWFFLGSYVLLGLVFAGICGYRALNHCLNAVPWFFAGFFFNIAGYFVLLTRHPDERKPALLGLPKGLVKIPATYAPRPCPGCGAMNHPSASSCSGCGAKLQPLVPSEVAKAGLPSRRAH